MSDGLNVDIRAETFLASLKGAADRLAANLLRAVTRLSIEIQTAVKRKLSGEVLHNRTGTLRRSINRVVTQDSHGVIATEGTNVRYAAIHEYGFNGEVTVAEHVRKAAGAAVGKKGGKTPAGGTVNVRSHVRHVVMPERSFLRSTLRDFTPKIQTDLRAAALEALR